MQGRRAFGADFRSCYRATYGIETTGLAEVVTFRDAHGAPGRARCAPRRQARRPPSRPSRRGAATACSPTSAAMVAAPVHLWDALVPGVVL